MSDGSHIQWTEATWNFLSGCTKISEGCLNCYIERTPPFRMAHRRFDKAGIGGTTGVKLHSDKLGLPTKWRKPRRIFVNSLADLFHEDVPDRFIAEAFAVMALAPQHTYQVLTKRHARMRSLLAGAHTNGFLDAVVNALFARGFSGGIEWPLPQVWVGVSVENQHWANIRIPALLATPAAVRWLSCEPLLGTVDLALDAGKCATCGEWEKNATEHPRCPSCGQPWTSVGARPDWVVAGGESGPGARPMAPGWARDVRDQCVAADVPFFFKQWGEWGWDGTGGIGHFRHPERLVGPELTDFKPAGHRAVMTRVGKKAAGRELDGRTWDEYPQVAEAVIV